MQPVYKRVWLSIEMAIDQVAEAAKCDSQEARDALVQAAIDGEIRSRFGDNGLQEIKPFLWQDTKRCAPFGGLEARPPNRSMIIGDGAYLRPFFDPPPDSSLLPERLRPVEVRREDVERLWPAATASKEHLASAAVYDTPAGALAPNSPLGILRTGLQGRPTGWHLIEAECRRRLEHGEDYPTRTEWAQILVEWFRAQHPSAQPPTEKTVRNNLSPLLRRLKPDRPK